MESQNYELWQPVCQRLGPTVRCGFDVTSQEYRCLNEGDAELFKGFLGDLDVCDGEVRGWTVRRFVTPFYAYDPAEEDWQLLFGLAWRVNLEITNVRRYRPCGKVGPYPGHGLDPTWTDGQNVTASEKEECVLIATEGPTQEFSFLTESGAGGNLEVVEYPFPHATVLQGRLNLGVVKLPESAGTVRKLLGAAKVRFTTTHWSDAVRRSAWQQPAEWVTVA